MLSVDIPLFQGGGGISVYKPLLNCVPFFQHDWLQTRGQQDGHLPWGRHWFFVLNLPTHHSQILHVRHCPARIPVSSFRLRSRMNAYTLFYQACREEHKNRFPDESVRKWDREENMLFVHRRVRYHIVYCLDVSFVWLMQCWRVQSRLAWILPPKWAFLDPDPTK